MPGNPACAAALSAQRKKTDKADTLGIAHIKRTGSFRQAHIESESCYRMRLMLTQRRNLKTRFLDQENTIRHSLKAFGLKLGGASRGTFDQAVRAAVADARLADPALHVDRGAGLPASRCQSEVSRDITRPAEARWIVDRRHEAQRRGYDVEANPIRTPVHPADVLRTEVADRKIGTIVIEVYGHRGLRERLFGYTKTRLLESRHAVCLSLRGPSSTHFPWEVSHDSTSG